MNTMVMSKRIGTLAATFAGLVALAGAGAAPVHAAPSPDAAAVPLTDSNLAVNVVCNEDKTFAWDAAYHAGAPNTQYDVYADYRYDTGGFDGGGSFGLDPLAVEMAAGTYHGIFSTGLLGVGSTNTFYGNAGPNASRVYVTVTINGYTQEGWDNC